MASMPKDRVGPPPRSLAVDAHDCIMVRIPKGSTEYKVVARRPRYDLAGSASDCLSQTTFAARRILGMAHYCSARAFPVNPARLKACPLRARGLTAQRGQATAPPCQEWNRVRPNGGTGHRQSLHLRSKV